MSKDQLVNIVILLVNVFLCSVPGGVLAFDIIHN